MKMLQAAAVIGVVATMSCDSQSPWWHGVTSASEGRESKAGSRKAVAQAVAAIQRKVVRDIEYVLNHGYADRIDERDLYHVHVVIDRNYLAKRYGPADREAAILDDRVQLLYHTHMDDPTRRDAANLLATLDDVPAVLLAPHGRRLVDPQSLGLTELMQIDFAIGADGHHELADGRRIAFTCHGRY